MSLPRIMYGTAWKEGRTASLIVSAVIQGFRAIDTACQPKHYNEPQVGEALETLRNEYNIKREELFLQTKYTPIGGQDVSKPLPYNPSDSVTDQILSSFQQSLKNLRTTYIDSYILHSPLSTLDSTLEAWRTLVELQASGKVKLIGVSNTYDVAVLEALNRERKVQVVQNRWYEGNNWDKEVVAYCKANDILYQSFWTLTGSGSLMSNEHVRELARLSGATTAQVIYKLAQLHGVVPLSGTTKEVHMKEDVEVDKLDLHLYDSHVKSVLSLLS